MPVIRWVPLLLLGVGGLLIFKVSQPQALDRLVWWQAAMALWKSHPLVGAGLGSTEIVLPQLQIAGLFSQYPHSLPLQLAAEIGVLGTAAFGWVIYRFLKYSSSLSSRLAVGGFLITNCFDYSFLLPGISLPFWFLLGDATQERSCISETGEQLSLGRHSAKLTLTEAGSGKSSFPKVVIGNPVTKTLVMGGILLFTSASLIAVVKPFLASRQLTMGQYLMRTGQLDQAEKAFKAAIGKESLDPSPYAMLAETYVRRFHQDGASSWLDEAILAQEEAVHRQPHQAAGWAALAQFHYLRGEALAARRALQEAIRLAPARTEYQRLLTSLR